MRRYYLFHAFSRCEVGEKHGTFVLREQQAQMRTSRAEYLICWSAIVLVGFLGPSALMQAHAGAARGELAQPSGLDPKFGVGSWIWGAETRPWQECRFFKTFEVPEEVSKARLRVTADNFYRLFLDGRELGWGTDWSNLTEYDLAPALKPGRHVLCVDAVNDLDVAGIVLGLRMEFTDGRSMEIGTDNTWRIVPNEERDWERRTRASAHWPAAEDKGAYRTGMWAARIPSVQVAPPLRIPIVCFWQTKTFQISLASLFLAAMAGSLYLGGRLLMQSQAQLVVQRERARIARDVHDDLSGGLTKLVLLGEVAQRDFGSHPAVAQLAQICERTRNLMGLMNETIWLINSQRDTLPDFASYVCKYAETFFRSSSVRCRFDVETNLPAIPCDVGVRRNLFLAVKEVLNNTLRHSSATEVCLSIKWHGGNLRVSVQDNGAGFDPATVKTMGNGLRNIEERVREAGGKCSIVSRPSAGCRVDFQVPIAERKYRLAGLRRLLRRDSCSATNPGVLTVGSDRNWRP